MRNVTLRRLVLASAALLLASAIGFADPPAVVGRLNLVSGSVSFLPGSLDEWAPAIPNYPLTTGDHLWTDPGSRAEVHVGSAAIRMDSGTEMSFLTLEDQTVQLRLSQGSLNLRLRRLEQGETWEIDTINSVVTLLQPGSYRIDSTWSGEVDVTVRSGRAEVAAGYDVFDVPPGFSAHVSGTTNGLAYWVQPAPGMDDWDAWCRARDGREDRLLASLRYVPPEMIGIEDLDDNGVWMAMAGIGPVWIPSHVPAGWAPYRFGRWAWVAPWGWTWIDDAPWGFAPFHYGRWAYLQARWVWIPGAIVPRPVYAPALVVFVGGSSPDSLGWFPLGPREVYVPPYQASVTYVQHLNVANVTNITVQVIQQINVTRVVYVNRTVPSAVTVVPRQDFVQARPIREGEIRPGSVVVQRLPVIGMGAQLTPQRESVFGQVLGPQVMVAQPPAALVNRPVYSLRTPAAPPQPFRPVNTPYGPQEGQPQVNAPQQGQPQVNAPQQGQPQVIGPGQGQPQPGVIVISPTNRVPNPPATRPAGINAPGNQPGAVVGPANQPGTVVGPADQPGAVVGPANQPTSPTGPANQPVSPTGPNAQPGQGTQPGQGNRPSGEPGPNAQRGADPQPLLTNLEQRRVPDLEKRLEDARKVRGVKLDYNALKKRLQDIRKALQAAQKDLKEGKRELALQQAQSAQGQLDEVERIIAEALRQAGGAGQQGQQPAGQGAGNPVKGPGRSP